MRSSGSAQLPRLLAEFLTVNWCRTSKRVHLIAGLLRMSSAEVLGPVPHAEALAQVIAPWRALARTCHFRDDVDQFSRRLLPIDRARSSCSREDVASTRYEFRRRTGVKSTNRIAFETVYFR